jgi:hypothetical protein
VKHLNEPLTPLEVDQFGRASAAILSQGSQNLPSHIKNRLQAARVKALSVRKTEKVRAQKPAFAGIAANWSPRSSNGLWDNVGWIAPVVVVVFGLIGIAQWQDDSRIHDIAEVDAALLTDDVPPDAYADSGFMAFLKNGSPTDSEDKTSALEQSK